MILTCPRCSTRYHVDPATLGPAGRSVRCAGCGERWNVTPPSDTPRAVEFGSPLPEATSHPPDPASARGSTGMIGWLAAALAVLLLASAVIARNEIVAGFPASAPIYQTLGLPITVNLGLEFEGVKSTRLEEGGISVLVVEGAIVNVTSSDRPVPPIRITLLDQGGRQLQEELFEAKEQHLEPGAKTSFTGRVVVPAERARNFSVSFEAGF
jgi:predicted Zn finger-like uncharacterized protein